MKAPSKALVGWFLIALFFCYQYALRVIPGVISEELRHAFYMTAEDFSSLGSYYLYAYAFAQIPLGFIVDRVGIKKTILVSIALCILGTLWLTISQSLLEVQFSRVLVGLGSACSFMCPLKWVSDHFPADKRAGLMGASLALGTLGALSAGHPLVSAVDALGWQTAVLWTGYTGIGIFALVALFLPAHVKISISSKETSKSTGFFTDFMSVFKNKKLWLFSGLAIGVYTPLAILADLWGVSFLIAKFNLSRSDAATTAMLIYVGLAVGSLIIPGLAERFRAFRFVIRLSLVLLCVMFSWEIGCTYLGSTSLKILFFVTGMLCGTEMICFSCALFHVDPKISGLGIGFVNTMNMMGGAMLQQLIGFLLDIQWTGAVDDAGVRVYSADDYTWALAVLPATLLLCTLLSLTLKKTDTTPPLKSAV